MDFLHERHDPIARIHATKSRQAKLGSSESAATKFMAAAVLVLGPSNGIDAEARMPKS
jgi:hypothetical protein